MSPEAESELELGDGVWADVPADVYHADPVPGGSLSHSIAKLMLPPSCPAKARYVQLHGSKDKAEFDFGRAAHRRILGAGEEIVEVKADNWRTAAAKQARDEARAAGNAPVLSRELEVIEAMAEALRDHPTAAALMDPASGDPEVTLVWTDERTGIKLRARLDWLRRPVPGQRRILWDYKTAAKGDPDSWARAVYDYGYHSQGDHYLDGVAHLLGDDAGFVFIVQEREPPYVVSCYQLYYLARQIGAADNRRARDLYAQCLESDRWPGYVPDDEPYLLSLPRWVEVREGFS